MSDHEPAMHGVKTCTRCGVEKPVLAFPARHRNLDGLDSWCRSCHCEVNEYKRPAKRPRFACSW